MSFINLGSTTAFNAIAALSTVAVMLSYILSISCVLWRRICHPSTMPPARWSLGRWGIPINIAGVLYSSFTFFWALWPSTMVEDRGDFNWAVVMFILVTALALGMFALQGRKRYKGPVT